MPTEESASYERGSFSLLLVMGFRMEPGVSVSETLRPQASAFDQKVFNIQVLC